MDRDVVLTHTAKSKAFRYLDQYQVEAAIAEHTGRVYYNAERDQWLVPTKRRKHSPNWNHEREETIVLIVAVDGDTLVVVTQTSDHYDWSDYVEVPTVGVEPEDVDDE